MKPLSSQAGWRVRAPHVPAHVLRLGARSGAVAAPTDLLLDQVLYAVVHLQVLQETEPWLVTVSWGQAGCGHTDRLLRNAPV